MKKNLFFVVVVLLSVFSFSSCAYEELNELSAALPPVEETTPVEEEEEEIEWEYSHSTLVKNETTLENGVVDFEIIVKDIYTAVYMGETVNKDSLRTYNFSTIQSAEWRAINLAFSKGYKAYQSEFTNHNNMARQSYVEMDSTFCEEGGWKVLRESKAAHFNYVSSTCEEDGFDPVASCNNFAGTFTDEKLGEIQLQPVVITVYPRGYESKHHKDETYRYDGESGTWLDRPWETEEDRQSSRSAVENGKEYLRYPIFITAEFSCEDFGLSEKFVAEYDYWILFNREEAIAEGSAIPF